MRHMGHMGHLLNHLFTEICFYIQRLFLQKKLRPCVKVFDFGLRIMFFRKVISVSENDEHRLLSVYPDTAS